MSLASQISLGGFMRIRLMQVLPKRDLYASYQEACKNGEIFDAFTLGGKVYIQSNNSLNFNDFCEKIKPVQLYQYQECESYEEYVKLQQQHINAILPNRTILTIFTNYNRHEFEQVMNGDFIKPKPKSTIKGISEEIYNSNKIEGINVSLVDTTTILAGGTAINVAYNDEISILNAKDAYRVRMLTDKILTEPQYLCHLHYELMKGLMKDAGMFRTYNVSIGSASHTFPDYTNVHHLIDRLVEIDHNNYLLKVAYLHAEFINIHPFGDGNGRIGRLFTHPYANIPFECRLEYYMALDVYGKYKNIYSLYSLLYSLNYENDNFSYENKF